MGGGGRVHLRGLQEGLHQQELVGGDFADPVLRCMDPVDHGRVGGPAVEASADPILQRAGRIACLEAFAQFTAETPNFAGHAVGQGKLVGTPARDRGRGPVGPGHEALHGASPFYPEGSACQGEDIPDAQASEEAFLNGADPRVPQEHLDHTFAGNGADVLEEVPPGGARAHFEGVGLEVDFAEEVGVLPAEGLAAAGQEIEHRVEVGTGEVSVRVGFLDVLVGFVARPRRDAGQTHEVLGEHVERCFGDADAVEVARPRQKGSRTTFHQVADIGGHEQSAAHLMNAVPRAPHPLQGPGHALRRRQEYHQVDAPNVDA